MLFGKNRDSEIGLWLPNCTRCARTILLTTANFRTLFFPNSTTDPPITYTNWLQQQSLAFQVLTLVNILKILFNMHTHVNTRTVHETYHMSQLYSQQKYSSVRYLIFESDTLYCLLYLDNKCFESMLAEQYGFKHSLVYFANATMHI